MAARRYEISVRVFPTWNGISTLLSRKKNFAPVSKLIIGDTVITDPHELSNAFNRHFVDIGPNLAANINPPRVSFRDFVEPCESTFELELLTIDGLRKLVNNIPAGKADGLDGILTCLLKDVSGAEHGGHEFQSSDFSVLFLTYLF